MCWLNEWGFWVGRYSTSAQRMEDLHQLQFPEELRDCYGQVVQWPPPANMCDSDSECECECQDQPGEPFRPCRGEAGWGDCYANYYFTVDYVTPEPVRARRARLMFSQVHQEPLTASLHTCLDRGSLLVTNSSSCRNATAAEVQEFEQSTAASDGVRFDFYLSHGREEESTYVFLAPFELRVTGRVKPCMPPTAE